MHFIVISNSDKILANCLSVKWTDCKSPAKSCNHWISAVSHCFDRAGAGSRLQTLAPSAGKGNLRPKLTHESVGIQRVNNWRGTRAEVSRSEMNWTTSVKSDTNGFSIGKWYKINNGFNTNDLINKLQNKWLIWLMGFPCFSYRSWCFLLSSIGLWWIMWNYIRAALLEYWFTSILLQLHMVTFLMGIIYVHKRFQCRISFNQRHRCVQRWVRLPAAVDAYVRLG